MEGVKGRINMWKASNSSSSSNSSTTQVEEDIGDLRRGPWTVEEDFKLNNYIASHGEGRWNSLACCAGLKRTGKSCRLRWLNYLRPDVRRGNITLEEQLMILELHSQWGNRWSKIAQHLPGRTDNEIKNYWRTRVQKHAKQLKCDVNSKQFKDAMRCLWMPRLVERIQVAAVAASSYSSSSSSSSTATTSSTSTTPTTATLNITSNAVVPPCGGINGTSHPLINNNIVGAIYGNPVITPRPRGGGVIGSGSGSNTQNVSHSTPDNSSTTSTTAASSDSFDTPDYYNNIAANQSHNTELEYNQSGPVGPHYAAAHSINSSLAGADYFSQGFDFQAIDQHTQWFDVAGETTDNFWNVEDIWFLQQQLQYNNNNNNM